MCVYCIHTYNYIIAQQINIISINHFIHFVKSALSRGLTSRTAGNVMSNNQGASNTTPGYQHKQCKY